MLQQMREKELSDVVERPKNRERTGCSKGERCSMNDVVQRLRNRERTGCSK